MEGGSDDRRCGGMACGLGPARSIVSWRPEAIARTLRARPTDPVAS
jgi:hypothetical protein